MYESFITYEVENKESYFTLLVQAASICQNSLITAFQSIILLYIPLAWFRGSRQDKGLHREA